MKYKFSLDKGHFITGLTMVKKNLNHNRFNDGKKEFEFSKFN